MDKLSQTEDPLDVLVLRAAAVVEGVKTERAVSARLETLGRQLTRQRLSVRFTDDLPGDAIGEYVDFTKSIRLHRGLLGHPANLAATAIHEFAHAMRPGERGAKAEYDIDHVAAETLAKLRRHLGRHGLTLEQFLGLE